MVSGCYYISILLRGVTVPHRGQSPLHQRHRLFMGVVQRVSMSDICEVAGWSSPSTFVRFYNLDVPAVQATVLSAEIAIFWVHLTNIAQAPSFAWSVHKLYGHQVSFCILRTPLGLIPRESLFELFCTIARHDWTGYHTASSTP